MTEELKADRRTLLDQGNRLKAEARRLAAAGDQASATPLLDERTDLRKRYIALLPEVQVARCPFSDDVVRWPIDTVDLDGWFWDHDAPARRQPAVPKKWLAMTGAMRLAETVAPAPFSCLPGPGAPFVVPRLLGEQGVLAVISQISVGAHTGWPITYFGPLPGDRGLENLWGTGGFPVFDDDGDFLGTGETPPWPPRYDFDLEPWLESGKLLWVAPGDESVVLREGADQCPYVGIEGPHGIAFVENGGVRHWNPSSAP